MNSYNEYSNVNINDVVGAGVNFSLNLTYKKIDKKLHQMEIRSIRNAIINLILTVIAILFLVFKPISESFSNSMAHLFFLLALLLCIVRATKTFLSYGEMIISLGWKIISKVSWSKGTQEFVYTKWPIVAKIFLSIDVTSVFLPSLKPVSSLEKIVSRFLKDYKIRFVLVLIIGLLYILSFKWAKTEIIKYLEFIKIFNLF